MRTRLGWCVFGPMNAPSDGRESVSCHVVKTSQFATSIPTKDILSGKVSNHHFSESTNIKDGAINHFLAGMYNNEFNEVVNALNDVGVNVYIAPQYYFLVEYCRKIEKNIFHSFDDCTSENNLPL